MRGTRSAQRAAPAALLVVLPLLLPVPSPAGHAHAPPEVARGGSARPEGGWSFASMPDFLNQDVADLRTAPCSRWRRGDPNSELPGYETQISRVLDAVAGTGARDVLVPGDVVEGRWGLDTRHTGIFGPVRSEPQRVRAVQRAACAYYPAWRARFARHGLRVYPAVGDHELGDDHWRRRDGGYARFKWRHVQLFKSLWVRGALGGRTSGSHPREGQARRTAYATYLRPEVLLVTVDEFVRTRNEVRVGMDAGQLRWLGHTLARARHRGVDWVVVQGHVPVLRPVPSRHSSSPPLRFPGGSRSRFWRLLATFGVDAYLCGEVHATSARTARGVVQVCHGGLFYAGQAAFLTGHGSGRLLTLRSWALRGRVLHGSGRLWQTDRAVGGSGVRYDRRPRETGLLEVTRDGRVRRSSGLLRLRHGS